jgi:hypothetical protein
VGAGPCAAVRGGRRAARSAPHGPTRLARAPAHTGPHAPPRPRAPPPLARHPLAPLVDPRVGRGLPRGPPCGGPRGARRTEPGVLGLPAPHAPPPARRPRGPLPPPPRLEGRGPRGQARPAPPLTPAHTLEAGRRPGALRRAGGHGPGPMAVLRGGARGPLAPLPPVTRTLRVPQHPPPHRAHVQPHALGSTPTAGARQGGGLHDLGRDPVSLHTPMPPAACATRCITTDHGGRGRQTPAAGGLGACVEPALLLPRRHGARARLVPMARRAAERPGVFPQGTGHTHGARGCGLLRMAGREGRQGLAPPGCSMQVMAQKRTNNGPLKESADKHSIYPQMRSTIFDTTYRN